MKKFCLVTLLGLTLGFSNLLGNTEDNSTISSEIPYFIDGKVIDIRNGSELTVLSEGVVYHVVLSTITSPSINEKNGKEAKKSLQSICEYKNTNVVFFKKDKYNKIIGNVTCDDVNANIYQLMVGYAKVQDKNSEYYEYSELNQYQNYAKYKKIGIWK
jgi:predicted staphylococcal nuclease homologue|nr:MAG TPA: nuclease-like protein [Caudoviricetes sp.]